MYMNQMHMNAFGYVTVVWYTPYSWKCWQICECTTKLNSANCYVTLCGWSIILKLSIESNQHALAAKIPSLLEEEQQMNQHQLSIKPSDTDRKAVKLIFKLFEQSSKYNSHQN